jgi:hypothetical protein
MRADEHYEVNSSFTQFCEKRLTPFVAGTDVRLQAGLGYVSQ